MIHQAQRNFVNRKIFVAFFDDGLDRHVAEQGDFFTISSGQVRVRCDKSECLAEYRSVATGQRSVGLVWSSASPAAFRYGTERQVNVQTIFLADVQRKLSNRFQERQTFDVADRPANLGDHDVDIVAGQLGECSV